LGALLVATLAAAAWASGLTLHDLGLGHSTRLSGLRWGGAAAFVVAVAYTAAYIVPSVRSAVGNSVPHAWSSDLAKIVLIIPLGTVIPEELAFRGVLLSLLWDRYGPLLAGTASSVLFALWHVLPALGGGAANEALDRSLGASPAADTAPLAATMVVTFLAGMLLCALRRRSRSLLAPVLAHWAVNGFGVVLVRLA
jgi:membrane protease YdiL (CAAX protease family)